MGYNGWENHQTWAVFLWMSNEGCAGGPEVVLDVAQDHLRKSNGDRKLASATLAEWIRDAITSELEDQLPTRGLAGDLVGDPLSRVNWSEIASHCLNELDD